MTSAEERARELALRVGDKVFGGRCERDQYIADAVSAVWKSMATVLREHVPGTWICFKCRQPWPCPTVREVWEALDA